MNREVKFRGKSDIGNEWIYGSYLFDKEENDHLIIKAPANEFTNVQVFLVEGESVGEFIGLQDVNGIDIYEGDVLLSHLKQVNEFETNPFQFVVQYDPEEGFWQYEINPEETEVIGNIYDNKNIPI